MSRLPLLLLTLGLSACHQRSHETHEPTRYLVTSPLRQDVDLRQEYVAQIRAQQHIELRALEKGYLQTTFVDEGQQVSRGTKLFQILPIVYQAEVQKAAAEIDLSQVEYDNTKLLADKNVVAPSELALAQAKLQRAKAQQALATAQKSMTELRAPFDGIVGRFAVRTGSLLSEGDRLTTLSDNRTVWVYFNLNEVEYLQHKFAQPGVPATEVRLRLANGAEFEHVGTIDTLEADFNNQTGNLAVRASFPNPEGLLRHGATGKVLLDQRVPNALVIPQKATYDVLDRKYALVVDEHGTVHAKPIAVRAELPQLYLVESGLTEHDRILVDGLRKVHDGDRIETNYQDPTLVLSKLEVAAE